MVDTRASKRKILHEKGIIGIIKNKLDDLRKQVSNIREGILPGAHASTHGEGGTDELNLGNLPGDIDDVDDVTPDAPSGFDASDIAVNTIVDDDGVTKTWFTVTIPRVSNAHGYLVSYRKTGTQDFRHIFVEQTTGTTPPNPTTETEYVELNTAYYFKLCCVSKLNSYSDWTDEVNKTSGQDTSAPSTPTGLTATNIMGGIFIDWNAVSAKDISHYGIYISDTSTPPDNPTYTTRATVFFYKTTDYGTTKYIWLSAVDNSGNESDKTSYVTASALNVDVADLATSAVTEAKLADGAVATAKLANLAVETGKLDNLAVEAGKLADGAVVTDKIAALAVSDVKIGAGAVVESKIGSGAVVADKIGAGAVVADKIGAGAVIAAKIAAGAIESDKIAANAIVADKIAANAVISDKINANAVTTAKINALAVTAAKIAAGAIETDKLDANAVTAAKIAANAVTTSELQFDRVTEDPAGEGKLWYRSEASIDQLRFRGTSGKVGYIPRFPLTISGAPPENLISNSSFEEDHDEDDIPDFWSETITSGSGSVEIDSNNSQIGKNSVKVTANTTSSKVACRSALIPIKPDQKYYWQVKAKPQRSNNSDISFIVVFYQRDGTTGVGYCGDFSNDGTAGSWSTFSGEFTPEDYDQFLSGQGDSIRYCRVELTTDNPDVASAYVFFDNVILSEARAITPTQEVVAAAGGASGGQISCPTETWTEVVSTTIPSEAHETLFVHIRITRVGANVMLYGHVRLKINSTYYPYESGVIIYMAHDTNPIGIMILPVPGDHQGDTIRLEYYNYCEQSNHTAQIAFWGHSPHKHQ